MSRDYLDLYQEGAGSAGATTVGSGGLGMTAAERASVPSYKSRKKRKKGSLTSPPKTGNRGPDALGQPSMMTRTPDP